MKSRDFVHRYWFTARWRHRLDQRLALGTLMSVLLRWNNFYDAVSRSDTYRNYFKQADRIIIMAVSRLTVADVREKNRQRKLIIVDGNVSWDHS